MRRTETDEPTWPRPEEDRYAGREEYVAQILSCAWMSKYIAEHAPPRLDVTDYAPERVAQADRLEEQSEPPPPEGETTQTP